MGIIQGLSRVITSQVKKEGLAIKRKARILAASLSIAALSGLKDTKTANIPTADVLIVNNSKKTAPPIKEPLPKSEEEKCGYYFGESLDDRKVPEDRISLLQAFIRAYPKCTNFIIRAQMRIATIYHNKLHDDHNAIEAYRKVVAIYPATEQAKTALSSINDIYLSRIFLSRYDLENTYKILLEFQQKYPEALDNEIISVINAIKRFDKDNSSLFSTRLQEFLRVVKARLKIEPSQNVLLAIADIYNSFYNDIEKALDFYAKASKGKDAKIKQEALFNIAGIHEFKLGDFPKALEVYHSILNIFPKLYVSIQDKGESYVVQTASEVAKVELKLHIASIYEEKLKLPHLAIEIYEEIAERNAEFGAYKAIGKIGGIYEKQGEYILSARAFERMGERLRAAYLYLRYGKGDFNNKAIELCNQILQAKGAHPSVRNNAQNLLTALNNPSFTGIIRFKSVKNLSVGHFEGTDTYLVFNGKTIETFTALQQINFIHNYKMEGVDVADSPEEPALQWQLKNVITVTFLNNAKSIDRKYDILEAFKLLPEGFYTGLEGVVVSGFGSTKGEKSGEYLYGKKMVVLYYGGFENFTIGWEDRFMAVKNNKLNYYRLKAVGC